MLYRALLATKRIESDPSQHRLAIYLQDLYYRLKDYEPAIEYHEKLNQISTALNRTSAATRSPTTLPWRHRETAQSKALVRSLTSHEGALEISSPRGLLLHGEVGTGKSMLIDLLADSLPNRKKRRYHFNTFMLEVLTKLEKLRLQRIGSQNNPAIQEETPLLSVSRDLVLDSPILFLDEFQLPDKAASKILSHLFTCFFQLGGVLVATSNRMPEELDKASGIEFVPPAPSTALSNLRDTLFGRISNQSITRPQVSDFAKFLEVLRARCEVWEIEGQRDWRRRESGSQTPVLGNIEKCTELESNTLPKYYLINSAAEFQQKVIQALPGSTGAFHTIPWQTKTLRVYGRDVIVPRCLDGVCLWTFRELCVARLGPADYISLASAFHTFIVEDVPVLHLLQRSEARRFITLLDALYESRAKLLIQAEAGPDDIFFPETPYLDSVDGYGIGESSDGTYAETFSEIYQDQTAPFRPNISSYASSASIPDYTPQPLPSIQPNVGANPDIRSILADEDADFGPTYGAGRSSGNDSARFDALARQTKAPPAEDIAAPNFQQSTVFTGEDERFAYKRAQSRLWEMCSQRWWARQEAGWWKPVAESARTWERDIQEAIQHIEQTHAKAIQEGEKPAQFPEEIFKHGASPFRVSTEPPPKISWVHTWGMTKWGRRAGLWGQGANKFENEDTEKQAKKQ